MSAIDSSMRVLGYVDFRTLVAFLLLIVPAVGLLLFALV